MSTEKMVAGLGKRLNRRNVLVRAGVGTVGALAALLGVPGRAGATVAYQCCQLCQWPSGCSGYACTWCWTCCNSSSGGRIFRCCEGYTSNASGQCGGPGTGSDGCGGYFKCSFAYATGGFCYGPTE